MRTACDFCLRRKRKCTSDGKGSCSMCSSKGLVCTFTPQVKCQKMKRPLEADSPLQGPNSLMRSSRTPYDQQSSAHSSGSDSSLTPKHIVRSPLSPSAATGLLGLVENAYLQTFLRANVGMPFCDRSDLQRAVSNRMLFKTHTGNFGTVDGAAFVSATSASALWACLAYGATLQNSADKSTVQSYLHMARMSMVGIDYIAAPEVLRVHLLMSEAYVFLQDFPRFGTSLNLAANIAKKIALVHRNTTAKSDAYQPPMLEEGLWFQLECLQFLQKVISNEVVKKIGCKKEVEELLCLDERREDGSIHQRKEESEAVHALSGFAPTIDGLPSFCPESLQKVYESGGYFPKSKTVQMARYNVVATILTELAHPNAKCSSALVHSATRGVTNLLPVVLGLHLRVAQLMRMVVVEVEIGPGSEAYTAGTQLRRIYEQLVKHLGYEYLRHPGINQLCLISDAAFLRLFMCDEKGCLQLLLLLYDNIMSGPGVMRFPFWCHTVQWITALLLSAGRRREHEELVRMYNSLEFANGANNMPTDYAEKASMYKCRHHECEGVHHILTENVATGRAKIFINHLALPDHNPELSISKDLQLLSLAEKPVASNIQEQLEVQASTPISSGKAQANQIPKSQDKLHASLLGQVLNSTFLTPESHFWGSEEGDTETSFITPPLTTRKFDQPPNILILSPEQKKKQLGGGVSVPPFIQQPSASKSARSMMPQNMSNFPEYTNQHLASSDAMYHNLNSYQNIAQPSILQRQQSMINIRHNAAVNNANVFPESSSEDIKDQQLMQILSDLFTSEENSDAF